MNFILHNPTELTKLIPQGKILRAREHMALFTSKSLIKAAKDQAAQIIEKAQQEREIELKRGYDQGMEEAQLQAAENMIENVSRTIDYLSNVEQQMVNLVMESVRKIFVDFNDEERTILVVKNALSVVRNQKQMVLRIAPDKVELVRGRLNDILSHFPGIGYIDIVSDGRLQADSCILETGIGTVEASLEGQLTALENVFRKTLGSRG